MIKLFEIGFFDWKYVAILEIEWYDWTGALFSIGTDGKQVELDILFTRQLYYWWKDR